MRYQIQNSQVWPSILIDAPYDSLQDATDDLNSGVTHNCVVCNGAPNDCKYNQVISDTLDVSNRS